MVNGGDSMLVQVAVTGCVEFLMRNNQSICYQPMYFDGKMEPIIHIVRIFFHFVCI